MWLAISSLLNAPDLFNSATLQVCGLSVVIAWRRCVHIRKGRIVADELPFGLAVLETRVLNAPFIFFYYLQECSSGKAKPSVKACGTLIGNRGLFKIGWIFSLCLFTFSRL